jgi:predicted nucleic acid-binding protein
MRKSAVVDTSVLVSAFLFPEGVPGRVVTLADRGVYALHFSPIIFEELRGPNKMRYKLLKTVCYEVVWSF